MSASRQSCGEREGETRTAGDEGWMLVCLSRVWCLLWGIKIYASWMFGWQGVWSKGEEARKGKPSECSCTWVYASHSQWIDRHSANTWFRFIQTTTKWSLDGRILERARVLTIHLKLSNMLHLLENINWILGNVAILAVRKEPALAPLRDFISILKSSRTTIGDIARKAHVRNITQSLRQEWCQYVYTHTSMRFVCFFFFFQRLCICVTWEVRQRTMGLAGYPRSTTSILIQSTT